MASYSPCPSGRKVSPGELRHDGYEVSCEIFPRYAANTLERIIQASSERWGSPTIFSSLKSFFFFCLQAHVKLIYSLIHSTHKTLLRFYISFYFFCSPCFPLSCSLFQLNTTFLWSTYVANYISNTSNALFLTPF